VCPQSVSGPPRDFRLEIVEEVVPVPGAGASGGRVGVFVEWVLAEGGSSVSRSSAALVFPRPWDDWPGGLTGVTVVAGGACGLVDRVPLATVGVILVGVTGAVSLRCRAGFGVPLDGVGGGCAGLCGRLCWKFRFLGSGPEDPRARFVAMGDLRDVGVLPGVGVRCLEPWRVSVFRRPRDGGCDLVFWVT